MTSLPLTAQAQTISEKLGLDEFMAELAEFKAAEDLKAEQYRKYCEQLVAAATPEQVPSIAKVTKWGWTLIGFLGNDGTIVIAREARNETGSIFADGECVID